MCSKSKNIINNSICPEKPLELMKFTDVHEKCEVKYFLKLCGCIQQLVFKNALCLVGNGLTLVVPKHICGKCKKCYKIKLPTNDDVVISDINMKSVPVTITCASYADVYYISIMVTENMIYDCELTLFITKLSLKLVDEPCPKDINERHSKDIQWQWIPSVLSH